MNVLVIGGAGFIGCNTADYYAQRGDGVTVFDNFSRKGTTENLRWLTSRHSKIEVVRGDIRRNQRELEECVAKADVVFHFAAQVAVTTSVVNPREDFEINALGTFNVLEAVRTSPNRPILIFASTNKVYGGMENVKTVERDRRYEYADLPMGCSEDQPLDFHSPYGCSKGAADQYVRDYSRIYALRTVVYRQSCIYGYRQFGVEDQGWVAHFTISAALGRPITIYGNGKQVRDLLFTTDLMEMYDRSIQRIDVTAGQVYNIGGGPERTLSLLELVEMLEEQFGIKMNPKYSDWRPGDQPVFICDIRKAKRDFGWEPKVSVQEGVRLLAEWVKKNKKEFESIYF
jgi:CDP-paratose 2-epimerase